MDEPKQAGSIIADAGELWVRRTGNDVASAWIRSRWPADRHPGDPPTAVTDEPLTANWADFNNPETIHSGADFLPGPETEPERLYTVVLDLFGVTAVRIPAGGHEKPWLLDDGERCDWVDLIQPVEILFEGIDD